MFASCTETKKETKEKEDAASTKQDSVNVSSESNSQLQGQKKRKLDSPEPESCKRAKYNHERNEHTIEAHKCNAILVAKHYNSLEDKGVSVRNRSRILYMRNFNNWIKSVLILEYKTKQNRVHGPLRVLDLCCGKGGDLIKWMKANITYLVCADLAQVSIEQCQQRYNDLLNRNRRGFDRLFTAEFITADCTKVRLREKYEDPSIQFDLVSCQFALHYSFETLQQAECMLRNASECLKTGGYFIGTIPDTYDLVSRWQKSDGNTFGNEVYNIEFLCDKKMPPLFGAKYNFHLEGAVNCPEFLVHIPTLCKLASKFGLELVKFERFDDYYERMKNEARTQLSNMHALETYPPCHGVPLFGDPKHDYQHAIQYMQNLPGYRKIGTLSKTEWEVISLYAVFAFKKTKIINNECNTKDVKDEDNN